MPPFDDKGGSFAAGLEKGVRDVNKVIARLKKLSEKAKKAAKKMRKELAKKKRARKRGRQ
jgi:hypothetical protein